MAKLSLMDKLKALFGLVFSSPFFLIVLISILLLVVFYFFSDKISKKVKKIVSIVIYVLLIGLVFVKYGSSILGMLDNLVDNVFSTIYFPSLVAYIIMQIVTNIIFLVSIISKKTKKLVKNINLAVFAVIQFLFVLILDVIITNNIDVYSELSVYTNTNLLSLIELSMIIFTLWIITLLIIKEIDVLNSKIGSKKLKSKYEAKLKKEALEEEIKKNNEENDEKEEVLEKIEDEIYDIKVSLDTQNSESDETKLTEDKDTIIEKEEKIDTKELKAEESLENIEEDASLLEPVELEVEDHNPHKIDNKNDEEWVFDDKEPVERRINILEDEVFNIKSSDVDEVKPEDESIDEFDERIRKIEKDIEALSDNTKNSHEEVLIPNITLDEEEVLLPSEIEDTYNDEDIELLEFDIPIEEPRVYITSNNSSNTDYTNILSKQFDYDTSSKDSIEYILNKKSINLEDYRMLKKYIERGNISEDLLRRIMNKIS